MDRRGFVGMALAGIGSFFFPRNVEASNSLEIGDFLLERITDQKIKWDMDIGGKPWIPKEAKDSWMVSFHDAHGVWIKMHGHGANRYANPDQAL